MIVRWLLPLGAVALSGCVMTGTPTSPPPFTDRGTAQAVRFEARSNPNVDVRQIPLESAEQRNLERSLREGIGARRIQITELVAVAATEAPLSREELDRVFERPNPPRGEWLRELTEGRTSRYVCGVFSVEAWQPSRPVDRQFDGPAFFWASDSFDPNMTRHGWFAMPSTNENFDVPGRCAGIGIHFAPAEGIIR